MFTEEYDDSPLTFVKEIRIYLNGDSTKYLDFRIVQNTLWNDIAIALDQKFSKFKTPRLFTQQGVEIFPDDILYLKDGYVLYASRGEEFNAYSPFSQYETAKVLGEGGFGRVTLGKHRITGELVAIKIIKMIGNAQDIELNFREAEVVRSLTHKNVVKIYNSYALKNNTQIAIIMEYLEGGELADRLKQKGGKFEEEEALTYFKQIVSAISYCHSKNIVHRDLKLENLLFVSSENDELKAIDFGIAGFLCISNTDNINIGSLMYMAPEVLSQKVNRVSFCVDIWAMGIILYRMLFGIFPFDGKNSQEIIQNIVNQELTFPKNTYSQEVLDLLSVMLEKQHQQRAHISDVEFHPWVNSLVRTKQIPKKLLLTPRESARKLKPSPSPRHSSPNLNLHQYQKQLQVPLSKYFK